MLGARFMKPVFGVVL